MKYLRKYNESLDWKEEHKAEIEQILNLAYDEDIYVNLTDHDDSFSIYFHQTNKSGKFDEIINNIKDRISALDIFHKSVGVDIFNKDEWVDADVHFYPKRYNLDEDGLQNLSEANDVINETVMAQDEATDIDQIMNILRDEGVNVFITKNDIATNEDYTSYVFSKEIFIKDYVELLYDIADRVANVVGEDRMEVFINNPNIYRESGINVLHQENTNDPLFNRADEIEEVLKLGTRNYNHLEHSMKLIRLTARVGNTYRFIIPSKRPSGTCFLMAKILYTNYT